MKTIKTTHIDNGGHGYLSVAKSDFLLVCTPDQITGCSGHNLTRMYLEEDCDMSVFMELAEAKGHKVEVKQSYNLNFKCTHNYKPALFGFEPRIGTEVQLHDGLFYEIIGVGFNNFVVAGNGKRYQLNDATCFEFMVDARTAGEVQPDMDAVLLFASQRMATLTEQAKGEGSVAYMAKNKLQDIMGLSKEEFHKQALVAYKSNMLLNA